MTNASGRIRMFSMISDIANEAVGGLLNASNMTGYAKNAELEFDIPKPFSVLSVKDLFITFKLINKPISSVNTEPMLYVTR